MSLSLFVAILIIARRGLPSLASGIFESLSAFIGELIMIFKVDAARYIQPHRWPCVRPWWPVAMSQHPLVGG